MTVSELVEHEDGSAAITFDMNVEEMKALLSVALTIGLIEGLRMVQQKLEKELDENSKD